MNYTYISRQELAEIIRNRPSTITIVDVRDDDHIGGHIKGSQHVPSSSLDYRLPELVRTLKDRPTVVFHCTMSQIRGPKAARRYGEERERLLGAKKENSDDVPEQKVFVLSGGFEKWVHGGYGPDPQLTEGFNPEIWSPED